MPTAGPDIFNSLSQTFDRSINAARLFAERIGPIADDHDQGRVEALLDAIKHAMGPEAWAIIEKDAEVELATPPEQRPATVASFPEDVKEVLKKRLSNTDVLLELASAARGLSLTPPWLGALLRRGTLITAVSFLDVLVAGLLRCFYSLQPKAFPADKRALTLEKIRLLGTLQAAEEHLIDQEVDRLLRRSFAKQLEYFKIKLKIEFSALGEYLPRLTETIQRRHLHVHNSGMINQRFLDNIAPELVAEYGLRIGVVAEVDDQYLRRALDRIHLAGLILIQDAWRKWFPDGAAAADSAFADYMFHAIEERRYTLAQNMGRFGRQLRLSSDANRRRLTINLAQAYKWAGDEVKMKEILEAEDWSACGPLFRLVRYALADDFVQFSAFLPKVVAAEEVNRPQLMSWPVFQSMRQNPGFASLLTTCLPVVATEGGVAVPSIEGGVAVPSIEGGVAVPSTEGSEVSPTTQGQ